MNDPDLLAAAMRAARYESAGLFARRILGVDHRQGRRWESGERELQGTARVVCAAIIARPELAIELEAIRRTLPGEAAIDENTRPSMSVHEYDPLNPPPSDADYDPLDPNRG